jgi:hypothetical protein
MHMHNVLSPGEISALLNDPVVKTNRANLNLSNAQNVVKFSLPLADEIRAKLSSRLAIAVPSTVPMWWIKGDTPLHVDRGEKQFSRTHLVYLTDSVGELIIDGRSYPIAAGDAHVFSEGLAHCTVNTGTTSERLMIGPMSEAGFGVGVSPSTILYFGNRTDAETNMNSISSSYEYVLATQNGISSWVIYKNEDFGGGGGAPTPNGGPYNAGYTLVNSGAYWVYPYVPPPPQTPARPLFLGRSLFANNAQVYYKSHSLSTGSGGSGVKNVRHKQRKT